MYISDWISIGIVLLAIALGVLLGFGKSLKIFTGGIVGIIISVVVTYFSIGVVASWGFVQELMGKLVSALINNGNGFCKFLRVIAIEKILLAIILFAIIFSLRILIVNIIKGVSEADNKLIRGLNRFFGVIFVLAITIMVTLLVFHLIDLIGGSAEESFVKFLHGAFRLDWVFTHNPLRYIVQQVMPT
ncbi:MAG: hypothetical protein ACI4MS_01335 [Candidatus Coproplasma sp.]